MVLLPGPALAWWDEFVVFSVAHTVAANKFIVSLEFRVHELDCSHLSKSKVAGFLFNREVHQVFPLIGNKSCGKWYSACQGIAKGEEGRLGACFEMSVM